MVPGVSRRYTASARLDTPCKSASAKAAESAALEAERAGPGKDVTEVMVASYA